MTEQQKTRSPWLPFGTCPDAGVRLLCLPHAGAGATVYRAWGAGMPPYIGACPVQPPGREKRRQEPALRTGAAIVTRLAPEVLSAVKQPYAIFGHSTGALCAFELAREIRRLGGPEPVHLFVAGRRAPQLPIERTELSDLSVSELAAVLRRLGGTPEQVLANPGMLTMIQPLLAADFEVNECYTYRAESPLSVPITAFSGDQDAGALPAQMAPWEEHSSAGFRLRSLTGGHFAIFDHASAVQDQISATLSAWS